LCRTTETEETGTVSHLKSDIRPFFLCKNETIRYNSNTNNSSQNCQSDKLEHTGHNLPQKASPSEQSKMNSNYYNMTSQQQLESFLPEVGKELEALRVKGMGPFPSACGRWLRSLPGNSACADCGKKIGYDAWASITYGSLYCIVCSGKHRSYGVAVSTVRSVDMDHWTHAQVLAVLEGGNEQLETFFSRHELGRTSAKRNVRYQTKAALFYATQMREHSSMLASSGVYQGREASRALYIQQQEQKKAAVKQACQAQQPDTSDVQQEAIKVR
jgi:hypothetical protein